MAVPPRLSVLAASALAWLLTTLSPAARAVTFPATWVGNSGNWIALSPGDWAMVDFSSPWKFFPDNSGSDYFLAFIPSGHVHLDAGVVPGELGLPVPFAGVSVSTLALDSNAELSVAGSGSLTVNGIEGVGGLITNLGRIVLSDSGSLSAPFALPILGSGEIALKSDNALLGGIGALTQDAAHTLSGFGTIASSLFINDGTVLADTPGKALRFTGAQLINGGTLKAGGRTPDAPGGELRLKPLTGFINDGQTIAANGLVKIESTDIDNDGALGAEALGTVVLEDVDVDNGGSFYVHSGGAFDLRGNNLLTGGSLEAALGTHFTVSNGVTELTGAITLSGELATAGGTLRFRNADITMHDGTVHLAAGTLANALVDNSFRGGRWTGTGELDVAASSTWDATSGMAFDHPTIKLFTGLHRWRGQFVNDGAIVLEETSFNSTLRFIVEGATRFDGQGALRVAVGDGNRFEAGTADAGLINGAGHTLSVAAGARATLDVAFHNEGLVTVDGVGASLLAQRDLRNAGVMSAANGGSLRFASPLAAGLIIDNLGGRIAASAGGEVLFGDGHPLSSTTTLRGGTLAGPGTLRGLNSMVLDGTTRGAITLETDTTLVRSGGTTTAFGTLINDGVLKLEDTTGFIGGASRLAVSGNLTVDGDGEILLTGNNETLINGTSASARLILGAGQTLRTASNTVGTVDVAVNNDGEVFGEGINSTLLVQREVINRGLMAARNGGTLHFNPAANDIVINNTAGRIEAGLGATVVLGGGHPLSPALTLRGGTLAGPGALRSGTGLQLDGVTNGAITIETGATLVRGGGTTTAFGTLFNDGVLKIEDTTGFLGGASRLAVSGNLAVDGDGEILLTGNSETLINGTDTSARMILGPGQRLRTAANTLGTVDLAVEIDGEVFGEGINSTLLVQREVINRGLMAARNGGTLHFNPAANGIVINNTAGRIEAELGSTVILGGGHPLSPALTLRGGILAGPGALRSGTGLQLDGVTNGAITIETGATLVRGGGTTTAFGTLINDGALKLEDTTGFIGGASRLAVSGNLAVDGDGEILLTGNSETLINGTDTSARMILGTGQRLRTAANTLGTVDLAVEIDGEVFGEGINSTLLVQRDVINRSVMAARNGGTLHFNPAANDIVINNTAGRIEAELGSTVILGGSRPLTLRGGILAGPGALRSGTGLQLDGVTDGAITIETGATLVRGGGATTAFGTLTNNGVIKLEDTTGFIGGASRLAVSGNLTVDGDGEILLAGNSETLINGTDTSARLTVGARQTLRTASNTFGTVDVTLENDGEVFGEGINSTLLVQRDVINRSVMAARNGGTLHFNPAATGIVINNTAGRIEAELGSTVTLGGSHPLTLRGGILAGPGALRSGTGLQLDGVTDGAITIEHGATLIRGGGTTTAFGTLINNGTLALEDTTPFLSGNARLAVAGSVHVGGLGSLRFTRGDEMLINGTDTSARLILGNGQTLTTQANSAGTVDVVVENHGLMQSEGTNSRLLLQRNVDNRGVMRARAGSVLSFVGSTVNGVVIDNHGGRLETEAGGVVQLGNGHPAAPFTHLLGGVIAGNGRVELTKATLTDGVTISPGLSTGTLSFGGNLNFDPQGTLDIELGGLSAGVEFDRVLVSGNTRLDGRLDIQLIDGFRPTDADVFRILTAASVTGAFDNLDDGLVNFLGGSFEVVVGTGFVELRNFVAAPVPLPATAGLLAVASLMLVRRRRVQRRGSLRSITIATR